jgi:hypothetical protein
MLGHSRFDESGFGGTERAIVNDLAAGGLGCRARTFIGPRCSVDKSVDNQHVNDGGDWTPSPSEERDQ